LYEWAWQELGGLDLGDIRRSERLVKTAGLLAERPGESLPRACGSWADTEAAYRLFDNERVSASAIRGAHYQNTARRAGLEPAVQVISDGSSQDFSGLVETTGLGHLESGDARGLDLHATLVATLDGRPLGLVDARFLARDPATKGKKHERRQKPTAEKESRVWLDSLAAAQERLPESVPFVFTADAEADIFELFCAPRRPNVHLLVRCSQPTRRVDHPAGQLGKAIRTVKPGGSFEVTLARGNGRKERSATLSLRWERLDILAPRHAIAPPARETSLWVVLAEEDVPPAGETPVSWLLLTTLPTESFREARSRTEAYARRWLVERYFYTLKEGCRAEQLQLGTADRLERALSLMCIVAWRLLWLALEARHDPHSSCERVLAEHEWKALYAYHYPTLPEAKKPPTLREAVRLIAKLGGFLGRKGDGEPGVKTLWLGIGVLQRLAEMYRSFAEKSPPDQGGDFRE
jgi:hypothetical protein